MAREIEKLSDVAVRKARKAGYHADGGGLYLQVAQRMQNGEPIAAVAKSWIFRFTLAGKTREMGLGPYPTFSLREARERAQAQRKFLADGIDPIAARDAQRAQETAQRASSMPFEQAAERYIEAHRTGWKNAKHVEQWRRTLTDHAEALAKRPVHTIDTAHVMRVLQPIWTKLPETASRLRGRIEHVLDWARVSGYRQGENPARWRGHLAKMLPKKSAVHRVEHLSALPYPKIAEFVRELREQPGVSARAVEFAILTAARSGEVRGAKASEFDLEAALWIVPAERMKAKKEHRVPLAPRAVELVRAQLKEHEGAESVFPGAKRSKPLSDMSLTAVLRRMKCEGITVHGFRSTFRDWAAEQTSYPRELAEFALAHALRSDVEAAYLRSDMMEKRRKLMRDWQRYIETPRAGADVGPMRRKAERRGA
jgi:integrase